MTPRGPIDEICVNTIRTLAIDAVQATRSGHPGTPLAMAPVVHTLWQDFLRCDPAEPRSLRAFFRPRFGAALRPIASERGWDGGSDSGRVPNTASPHRAGRRDSRHAHLRGLGAAREIWFHRRTSLRGCPRAARAQGVEP
jgi:hypothetical protein